MIKALGPDRLCRVPEEQGVEPMSCADSSYGTILHPLRKGFSVVCVHGFHCSVW